jgi:hypothetical protein
MFNPTSVQGPNFERSVDLMTSSKVVSTDTAYR